MSLAVLASVLAGLSAALIWSPVLRPVPLATPPPVGSATSSVAHSALRRHRLLLGALAAGGGISFADGPWGWVIASGLFVLVFVVADRIEPPALRREREAVRRDLPHVVQLLGIALSSGASVPSALEQVSIALPGPASDAFRVARARLALGTPPGQVWAELALHEGIEPLGRALARAERSGVPVADAVRHLGEELARERRLEVEDRARTIGIRAALPLGLCLLPAFLAVGIVPVIAAALDTLQW